MSRSDWSLCATPYIKKLLVCIYLQVLLCSATKGSFSRLPVNGCETKRLTPGNRQAWNLNCQSWRYGSSVTSVEFWKNGRLLNSTEQVKVRPNRGLVFTNLRKEDSGIYHCQFKGPAGQILSHRCMKITVGRIQRPKILQLGRSNSYLRLVAGKSDIIRCPTDHANLITWYKNEVKLFESAPERGEMFILMNVTRTDEGVYSCQAIGEGGITERVSFHREVVPEPAKGATPTSAPVISMTAHQTTTTPSSALKSTDRPQQNESQLDFIHILYELMSKAPCQHHDWLGHIRRKFLSKRIKGTVRDHCRHYCNISNSTVLNEGFFAAGDSCHRRARVGIKLAPSNVSFWLIYSLVQGSTKITIGMWAVTRLCVKSVKAHARHCWKDLRHAHSSKEPSFQTVTPGTKSYKNTTTSAVESVPVLTSVSVHMTTTSNPPMNSDIVMTITPTQVETSSGKRPRVSAHNLLLVFLYACIASFWV